LIDQPTSSSASASSALRQLVANRNQRYDYRLAWVGSDDAITHLGTGLHKVPLARLQEVFLTVPAAVGRPNQVMLQEVIRILGPFPNVRNTLQGSCRYETVARSSSSISSTASDSDSASTNTMTKWTIAWESMVDGTGKELLAGKAENVKRVDLDVYFADPAVLVAAVPPASDDNSNKKQKNAAVAAASTTEMDPLRDNGKNLLVFVREPDLDTKLEVLRVA